MHVKLRSDTILDYLFSETATWSLSTGCGGVSPLTLDKQGLNETTTAKAIRAYIHTYYIHILYYWAARKGNAQSRNAFGYAAKRQNGGRNSQEALRAPLPLHWGRFLRGGDGSFPVV